MTTSEESRKPTKKLESNRTHIRIFDDNHKDDWKFFFVMIIICNAIYFGIFNRMEYEQHMFPWVLIGFNLITPIAMFFCELGERSIYG